MGVHGRVVDQAASVREAAIDLVGRFVLDKPALTIKYYPMISERILDKGVGVRYVKSRYYNQLIVALQISLWFVLKITFLSILLFSFRKRVIKILRDICIQQPDFPKLTEICIKLIRRIDDEDGTQISHLFWQLSSCCLVPMPDSSLEVEPLTLLTFPLPGIRELVAKVFMDLWFSDNKGETKDGLIKRVVRYRTTPKFCPFNSSVMIFQSFLLNKV